MQSIQVANEIRAHLARQRRRQADLAEVLGLPASAVSRRLNGQIPFNVNEIAAVAEWLGVPVADLLGRGAA